jgi:hypothetical protein
LQIENPSSNGERHRRVRFRAKEKRVSRKLNRHSTLGPIEFGPLRSDALDRLSSWPEPLDLISSADQQQATGTSEQLSRCVELLDVLEAFFGNPRTLHGLIPGFQLIIALSMSGTVQADARSIASPLGTPSAEIETKPAYLVRVDIELAELIHQTVGESLAELSDDTFARLMLTASVPDRIAIQRHVERLTLLLAAFHELGHVFRGHLPPARPKVAHKIPRGANEELIDELDADLFANNALVSTLSSSSRPLPSGVTAAAVFALGGLAGRSLFATLARFGTSPSLTHPAKPVRAFWTVWDFAERLGIDKSSRKSFFELVDCRFGVSDTEIADEQERQAIAWRHWQLLEQLGYFKTYFP